jgi:uncharacterized protein
MDARGAWYWVGPLMGLTVVAMLWASNKPLGALGGYLDWRAFWQRPSEKLGWRALFLIGVVGGGLIHALLLGGFAPGLAYGGLAGSFGSPLIEALVLLVAGALLGFGARTANGCTSGHGITGCALGSPASFAATMTFMATAVISAHLLAWAFGAAR